MQTPAGKIAVIKTKPELRDRLGTVRARIGMSRNNYKVVPGLYAIGSPTQDSPVLATANYKLSFDCVRFAMHGRNAWLLVLDTRGINVWCAAGKGTFGTEELARIALASALGSVVSHRKIVVPQLGAPAIAAHELKRRCGFRCVFGPVRAEDLPDFLDADMQASEAMRTVTFTLSERAVLIPVELFLLRKSFPVLLAVLLVLAGIGPGWYSFDQVAARFPAMFLACVAGIISGAVLVPLLPGRFPFRMFWPKGLALGVPLTLAATLASGFTGIADLAANTLFGSALGGWMAMNFTGSTPFTSPSGVEAEMKKGIPVLAGLALTSAILWLVAPFVGN